MLFSASDDIVDYPRPARDLSGRAFGKLSVIGYVGKCENSNHYWLCFCTSCMSMTVKRGDVLKQGRARSCGEKGCRSRS
jgi:hypothetical protein